MDKKKVSLVHKNRKMKKASSYKVQNHQSAKLGCCSTPAVL